MKRKLCVKRLTASDLTFFEWHFRNRNAGNQKAINLNADVFVSLLFPALPEFASQRSGRIPLDLYIFGPGLKPELNLQRKIVKMGSYKNWRLNGEFIYNPTEDPERFNCLTAGDIAVMEFQGDVAPEIARLVLICSGVEADRGLWQKIGDRVAKMEKLSYAELSTFINEAKPPSEHPIYELMLDNDLEDAAQGGTQGTQRLLARRSGRRMSREQIAQARENADRMGATGEEIINAHFSGLKSAGRIKDFIWASLANALSPFDFKVTELDGSSTLIDVKSTDGEFERPIHISSAELREMVSESHIYRIFRLFNVELGSGTLRISSPMAMLAAEIQSRLATLPTGVTADSVSIRPSNLKFGESIPVKLPEE